MQDPFDGNRRKQSDEFRRKLGPEKFLEGSESLERELISLTERAERMERLTPHYHSHLMSATKEGRLTAALLSIAQFHPISCLATIQTLTEFGGRPVITSAQEEEFSTKLTATTLHMLKNIDAFSRSILQRMKLNYPEVDIARLLRAHKDGVLNESDLVNAFQLQSSLDQANRKIDDNRLSQEFI